MESDFGFIPEVFFLNFLTFLTSPLKDPKLLKIMSMENNVMWTSTCV